MTSTLSVLLPVFNAQHSLSQTVANVLELTPELTRQFEIAVIDDGSIDGTEEIACDLALRYPQVIVARHHRPRGITEAIHTGVLATTGDVIIVQPQDTEATPQEIRRLWQIGKGTEGSGDKQSTGSATSSREATIMARLLKWGQALKEEAAAREGGLQMLRREKYRRRSRPHQFRPNRLDAQEAIPTDSRPNFLAEVRNFALGE